MVLYTALCIIDIANLHIFYRLHQTVSQSWMLLLILFACSACRFITRFNQDPERCEVLAADTPHFCFRSAEVRRLRKLYPEASCFLFPHHSIARIARYLALHALHKSTKSNKGVQISRKITACPKTNFKPIVCIVSVRRIENPASSSCPHEATEKISYPR